MKKRAPRLTASYRRQFKSKASAEAAEKLGADDKTVGVIERVGMVGAVLTDGNDLADEDME